MFLQYREIWHTPPVENLKGASASSAAADNQRCLGNVSLIKRCTKAQKTKRDLISPDAANICGAYVHATTIASDALADKFNALHSARLIQLCKHH